MTAPSGGNPFSVTKAVDFSDDDIYKFWVDLPGNVPTLFDPSEQAAMLVLGGKGSGKTHLMRYLSVPVQLKVCGDDPAKVLRRGFIGIYLPCSGLNANRFSGKHQDGDVWRVVFQYYMDLSLLHLLLSTVYDLLPQSASALDVAGVKIGEIFYSRSYTINTMSDLLAYLQAERGAIDDAVNNAPITRSLNVTIRATPSELIFGGAKVLSAIEDLRECRFAFLLDEFENLGAEQQMYVNSLIREQRPPVSIKVGSRLYGIRTFDTYSAGEPIRAGSEFTELRLDEHVRRATDAHYQTFVAALCASRLRRHGIHVPSGTEAEAAFFRDAFQSPSEEGGDDKIFEFVTVKHPESSRRPWMVRLRRHLEEGRGSGLVPGVVSAKHVEQVIACISRPSHPLLERLSIHLLYQAWNDGRSVLGSAEELASRGQSTDDGFDDVLSEQMRRWRSDLTAQIYRDYRKPVPYHGWATLVDLSHGLPRNLLVMLKQTMIWSEFLNEAPFRGGRISFESQTSGIRKASEWFLNDAAIEGDEGDRLRGATRRLGELFRAYRYADKPSEVGLSTFSVDTGGLDRETARLLSRLVQWSLVVEVPRGHRDKNVSSRIDAKYQFNRLLATYWEISSARRGTLLLRADEVASLFDPSDARFREILRHRQKGMSPPFGVHKIDEDDRAQKELF